MTKRFSLSPYLYGAPCLILMGLFVYYPVVENIISGFYRFSPLSDVKVYIGFKNYTELFQDPVFYTGLKNSLLFALISVIAQVFGGMVIAAILEDSFFRKFSPVLRTVYFTPVLISMTVISLLFSFILNPETGLLNSALSSIGLESWTRGWLGDSATAIYAVIAVSQWQNIGYTLMLFVVAIQKIPADLYEAAKIDGANKFQSFFQVTVPQLKEVRFVLLIQCIAGSILIFTEVYIMTSGGPGYSSQVLSTYLFQKAFFSNEMGYASAIANVILVISMMIFIVQKKWLKTGEE
jgi:raffinose/stachyose/melibiose transport system permease protein